MNYLLLDNGDSRGLSSAEKAGESPLPADAILYGPDNLLGQGGSREPQPFEYDGKVYTPNINTHWKANFPVGMQKLAWATRLHVASNSLRFRRFATDFPYTGFGNVWTDTSTGSFTSEKYYVVQTNTKVIQRCLLMTTDPGDLVLDPTCGSGTTAYVAEQWGRRWITIDTSRVALALARTRLMGAKFPYYLLADSDEGRAKERELSGTVATVHDDPTHDVRRGFVYQRVPHVTLKSIANNPDIREGMTRAQIDEAIRRHAESETLYDKPYEDKNAVRVAGPFTVESLSPHRVLPAAEASPAPAPEGGEDFVSRILESLRKAGVQNTRRAERLTFDRIEAYPGEHLQAVGHYDESGTPKRAAICVGPEFGTVGPDLLSDAAREASRGIGFDLLLVCGFAFDPHTSEEGRVVEKQIGKMRVLLVRMNPDLAMDKLLKNTGAGNLFLVFGEPDVSLTETPDGRLTATVKGVDVFDPTTGEVRSAGPDEIACWFLDTDYDGESFFVRHAYFLGGQQPYEKLKKALKADIDEAAWSSLNSETSRPFDRPAGGKIAVKVINHYGDEVLKVYRVPVGKPSRV